MIQKICLLALAGALGTIARYGLAGFVHRLDGSAFPWGTFIVNVVGCFAAGFLWTLLENRLPVSGEMRTVILVGFMGAFTTFSAFILETGEFVRAAQWAYAVGNVAGQTGLGFVALFVGITFGRLL